jgi:UDP-N-acetylglucosamine/UDP-N-acetylgalactosamine diphosphorylase
MEISNTSFKNNELNFLQSTLSKYNQEHLLDYLRFIKDEDKKHNYIKQLNGIDYELIKNLFETILSNENSESIKAKSTYRDEDFSPIHSNFVKENFMESEYEHSFQLGLKKIYQGKVALLMLAGGQGSRLGLEKPKGMYNIKMPSNKSLFEYLCNRFLSVQNLAKSEIQNTNLEFKPSTLFIMTSVENHKDTVEFFQQNNYFNINPDDLIFFPQETIPAIDLNGKIINKDVDQIFLAPNGNGGCFISLKKNNIIEKCLEREIDFINVISVDNPLTITLDPLFVGLTYSQDYQMSAKTIKKNSPSESIGVFLNLKGKPTMMDYMDIPKHLTELKDDNGNFIYRGGNILNYLIGVNKLNEIILDDEKYKDLINEFHVGKKKIPGVILNEEKSEYLHKTIDGAKFELFFNSIFKFADSKGLLLLEVNRNEFAPVKNVENSNNDNPRTARMLMTKTFLEWYQRSGGVLNNVTETDEEFLLEISYLLSFNGENLFPGENIPKSIDNVGSYYLK